MIIASRRCAAALVAAVVLVLTCAVLGVVGGAAQPARAASAVSLTGYGADSCTAPTEAQMRAFWSNTPYSYWGVYIGGSDRGCAQPNLTRTWVSDMLTIGWDILPLWVGPQNPCTAGQASYFSTDPTTAASQGKAEALKAYDAWSALSSSSSVPIDYDLEAPSSDTATCRAAAKAFVNAWVAQLHVAPAQTAGVYSSSCAGYLDDFATVAHPPDFIDAADWDGTPSTGSISCVASTHWTSHQRHKQYQGGHNATYNGVTLAIDSRCADGPVFGAAARVSTTQACSRTQAAATAATVEAAAPATSAGAQWRSGGPADSQLQRLGPAGWQPVQVGDVPLVLHDVPVDAPTVGSPLTLADGSLVVPVTTHGAEATEQVWVSHDGVHFAERGSFPVGSVPDGVAAPVAPAAGGSVYVLEADGRHAHLWSASGGATEVGVSGLPAIPSTVRLSGDQGTATVESTTCRTKQACTPSVRTLTTTDGGRHWR